MKSIFLTVLLISSSIDPALALTPGQLDALVPKIILAESSGNPKAVGKSGERGLMQIERAEWMELSDWDWNKAFDPEKNVQVGRHMLEEINEHYLRHDPKRATAPRIVYTYNTGHYCYRKHLPHWTKSHPNKIYKALFKTDRKRTVTIIYINKKIGWIEK